MKTTVQKAYVLDESGIARTLVDSNGRIYVPRAGWIERPNWQVSRVPGPAYERWCDVPSAWLGGCPFFR